MIPYDLFFYVWLITTAVPLGAAIGLATGWTIRKMLNEKNRGIVIILVDAATGVIGFVVGACASVIGGGFIYERWENGRLVFRETTGFGDYMYVFALVGAVILVAMAHFWRAVGKRLPCKRNPDRKKPGPVQAV